MCERDSRNCGVFSAGMCTSLIHTWLRSCTSSARTLLQNPRKACLAPQYADCRGIPR